MKELDGRHILDAMSPTRWLRLLTIFAMLFATISMSGGHAAMAMPSGEGASAHHAQMSDMPPGHCEDMGGKQNPDSKNRSNIDCMISCSVIMAAAGAFADAPPPEMQTRTPLLVSIHDGLNPESDPPPPRLS